MRCKNCGADNDDNRYICENCGSPLYDEEDEININDGNTRTFKAVRDNDSPGSLQNDEIRTHNTQYDSQDAAYENHHKNSDDKNKKAEKKSIIIIAVLAVILVAIIIAVAVIAHNNKETQESETELTKYSTTTTVKETETSSKKQTTTEETTETTEKTTEKTTAATLWIINVSSSGGGEVEGDGKYKNGKTVTLIARPDDGYVFDGWYSEGVKVSSDTEYSFTANENASFSAQFTLAETTTDSNDNDAEIIYGE